MTCQICFNGYNHSIHRPYSLSNCPHTFCISCLNRLKSNKCPVCQAKFTAKHPNLSLMDYVPKDSYDEARDDLEIVVNQINASRTRLNNNKDKKKQEFISKIQEEKQKIRAKGNSLIQLIKSNVIKLEDELEFYESTIIYHLDNLKCEHHKEIAFDGNKDLFASNKLDEIQMLDLTADFKNTKRKFDDLNQEVTELKEDFQFIANSIIDTEIGCFGYIKDHEKVYH